MIDLCPDTPDGFDYHGGLDLSHGYRVPESADEVRSAIADGVGVHDLDGDCVGHVVSGGRVKIKYKLVGGEGDWTRDLDFIRIPENYQALPPVTEKELKDVFRSLGVWNDTEKIQYPENTIARATVRGVPDVLVLRRATGVGFDWAHTLTGGFTCSNDSEVTDVDVVVQAVPKP